MKRAAIILLALVLLLCIALGMYLFVFKEAPVAVPPPSTGDPFNFGTGSSGTVSGGLSLELDNGSSIEVPDFTKTNQPEWAGESAGYQVAGSDSGAYLITYIPADSSGSQAQFLISLSSEPLGEVRREAETELKKTLNLPENALCGLDVQVWTRNEVNQTYAGRDLGLSFCPGATKLP